MFTDIEGSTQRWDREPVAMAAALRRHDEFMRTAIERHGGYVFKTIGDAFCAAFAQPADAVAAIVAAQRACAEADFEAVGGLRFRAALHTGTADERDGDYFGPTVNRVARLLAIAHGGQAIVSGTTRELVRGSLASHVTLHDLGEHRLKDLSRPEHVFGVTVPDLPSDFPPLRSLRAVSNNLPSQPTALVGRETEIAAITALLGRHRLVTLVGSGGIGKTRASLQAAANVLDRRRDGVWFVELAPLATGAYLPTATAFALGIKLPEQGDPLAHLVRAARDKEALLIFDNCEHLSEAAGATIAALIAACPGITVLASSRQSLGVSGEHIYRVPPLSLAPPSEHQALNARAALQSGAVQLFVECARALDDRFALSDENASAVADICRRLDGIPLAIELAAARVRFLGPRQLNQRLDERFRLLTGGNRDRLARQQTLRALIDWSYDLLDLRERALFARMGIFVSGFALEGAIAVGSRGDLDEFELIDVLGSLVDKSLVLAEPDGDTLRYRLLESTRAYAREKLDAVAESQPAAERHLTYITARFRFARQAYLESGHPGIVDALLTVEKDDVRAALDFAVAAGLATFAAELLGCIESRWSTLGLIGEQVARCELVLSLLPSDAHELRARLLCLVAVFAGSTGQIGRLLAVATEAVQHARQCGDRDVLAEALRWYGDGHTIVGRFDVAEIALSEAEALPPLSKARALSILYARAHFAQKRGDLAGAAQLFRRSLAHYREEGDPPSIMGQLINLAEIEHARGHTAQALADANEALVPSRALGERMRLGLLLSNMAGYAVAIGDYAGSIAAAREAIAEIAARDVESPFIAVAIEHLALAYALQGDVERAAMLAGYADPILAKHGLERGFTERTTYDRLVVVLRDGLSARALAEHSARGAALSGRAVAALALTDRAPSP